MMTAYTTTCPMSAAIFGAVMLVLALVTIITVNSTQKTVKRVRVKRDQK